jgi:hypothetical protein
VAGGCTDVPADVIVARPHERGANHDDGDTVSNDSGSDLAVRTSPSSDATWR